MKKLISRVLTAAVFVGMLSSTVNYGREQTAQVKTVAQLSREQQMKLKQDEKAQRQAAKEIADKQAALAAAEDSNKPLVIDKAQGELNQALDKGKGLFERSADYLGEMSFTKKLLGATIGTGLVVLGASYAINRENSYVAQGANWTAGKMGEAYTAYAPQRLQDAATTVGSYASDAGEYVRGSRVNPYTWSIFNSTPTPQTPVIPVGQP